MPLINSEIWSSDSLQESYKTNDKLFYKNQSLITKTMIPVIQIMKNCKEKKNEKETFDLSCDAFQLLAYAHRDESNIRRQMLKPAVHKCYRKLCNPSTPVTENLFGDDLHKKLQISVKQGISQMIFRLTNKKENLHIPINNHQTC